MFFYAQKPNRMKEKKSLITVVGFKEKFANLNHPTSTPSAAKINQSLVFVVRLKRSPCSIPPHLSATTSTKKAFVAKRQFYNCVVKYFESYF